MSKPRFYCNVKLGPGAQLNLPEQPAHHASRVLRMKPGDALVLFNGDGNNYPGEITHISKDGVKVKIGDPVITKVESSLDVTLAQAISSGDRMDFTLQKAVELGISHIQPIAAERSVTKLQGDKAERRREHWQQVVISACEQSGRASLPEVAPPTSLATWLGNLKPFELKLMLSPEGNTTLHDLAKPAGAVCILIGCEGGFSSHEQAAAESCGFSGIRLGPRVLRTETAALATLAAMQTLWGDF